MRTRGIFSISIDDELVSSWGQALAFVWRRWGHRDGLTPLPVRCYFLGVSDGEIGW